jgi:hypothetical protein
MYRNGYVLHLLLYFIYNRPEATRILQSREENKKLKTTSSHDFMVEIRFVVLKHMVSYHCNLDSDIYARKEQLQSHLLCRIFMEIFQRKDSSYTLSSSGKMTGSNAKSMNEIYT